MFGQDIYPCALWIEMKLKFKRNLREMKLKWYWNEIKMLLYEIEDAIEMKLKWN